MDVNELLDEDAFKQENLFDKEKYNTLTISLTSGKAFKEDEVDMMLDLLNPSIDRDTKNDRLKFLKDKGCQKLLIKGIEEAEDIQDKATLLAACWESGLDFKEDFLFFIEKACHPDYMVALEASTVAGNLEDVTDEETITRAILIIDNDKKGNRQILEDLKTELLNRTR